jgi:hypothetical protein
MTFICWLHNIKKKTFKIWILNNINCTSEVLFSIWRIMYNPLHSFTWFTTHKIIELIWCVIPWNMSFSHSNTQNKTQACTHSIESQKSNIWCLPVTVSVFVCHCHSLWNSEFLSLDSSFLPHLSFDSFSLSSQTYNSSFPFPKTPLHTFSFANKMSPSFCISSVF